MDRMMNEEKQKEVMANELAQDLRGLGVRAGGVMMVHSSLGALGYVPGGAETIIQAMQEVLGEEGTLMMPALSYEHVTREQPYFDIRHTPANVGIIPETFRGLPRTLRSLHPTHSVCALGRRAQSLLEPHAQDSTPCGSNSPFHTLPEHDGQILMLGCGLEPNTSMHAIEEMCVPPYLYAQPITYRLRLADGSVQEKVYTPHGFDGWQQRYERAAQVLGVRGLREGQVLQARAYLIEAAALWEAALAALRGNPLYFVDKAQS